MNTPQSGRRIIVLVGAGAIFVLLAITGILAPLRGAVGNLVGAAGQPGTRTGQSLNSVLSDLRRVGQLATENARLQRENTSLRQRLAADTDTRRDNDALRRQLGLEVASTPREIAAEVQTFQPDSFRQFLSINRGQGAGVKVGQAVLSEGVLVGLISSVAPSSAVVKLTTDPEFRLAVRDQDREADGIIRGRLGGGLVMEKIDQSKQVRPGDTITTSGLGGNVPAGLLVGQIQSVDTRSNAIFQSAEVAAAAPTGRIRFVFVVVP